MQMNRYKAIRNYMISDEIEVEHVIGILRLSQDLTTHFRFNHYILSYSEKFCYCSRII